MDSKTRQAVWDRDNGLCKCGKAAQEIHHIQKKGMGGVHGNAKKISEHPDNLICICRDCHRRIHDGH